MRKFAGYTNLISNCGFVSSALPNSPKQDITNKKSVTPPLLRPANKTLPPSYDVFHVIWAQTISFFGITIFSENIAYWPNISSILFEGN